MDKNDLSGKICSFLLDAQKNNFHFRGQNPLASTNLYEDGWLNSLLNLQLVTFLEKELSVRISPFVVTQKNFSTISAITETMQKMLERQNEK